MAMDSNMLYIPVPQNDTTNSDTERTIARNARVSWVINGGRLEIGVYAKKERNWAAA